MPLILPKIGEAEYIEKKSQFLGYCAPIESEYHAKDIISQVSARHQKANHNCTCYSIKSLNIIRFNDDGEPSGTAGMPMLNVFEKAGVINYVCVVTRYFGGILLGAGGLVRAYTKAAKLAMDDAAPTELLTWLHFRVQCAYNQFDNVKYHFNKWNIEIIDIEYSENCTLYVKMTDDNTDEFLKGNFYTHELIDPSNL